MSNVKKIVGLCAAAIAVVPSFVSAQLINLGSGGNLEDVFTKLIFIVNAYVIPFIIGLAVILFLIGVLKYIMNADNEEERKKGAQGMIYGIIGLVVMFSFWGLIRFVQSSFGLKDGANSNGLVPPQIQPRQ